MSTQPLMELMEATQLKASGGEQSIMWPWLEVGALLGGVARGVLTVRGWRMKQHP